MKIDSYLSGFMITVICAGLSVLGLFIVQRRFDHKRLAAAHDVPGYFLSVVGTLYAVLLGLIVVDAMSRFQRAQQTSEDEANFLSDIFMLAGQLPDAKRREIHDLCRTYVNTVINEEWAVMDEGTYIPKARATAIALMNAVVNYEPVSESQKAVYAAELTAITQFWDCRRYRIIECSHGVPRLEWTALILGGIITVIFTYFFRLENAKVQAFLTALLAMTIALNIYLVLMFGYPYSGDLKVGLDSFQVAQAIFEQTK